MKKKKFDGEFISAETGNEEAYYGNTFAEVANKLSSMKDGDSLVVNAREEK